MAVTEEVRWEGTNGLNTLISRRANLLSRPQKLSVHFSMPLTVLIHIGATNRPLRGKLQCSFCTGLTLPLYTYAMLSRTQRNSLSRETSTAWVIIGYLLEIPSTDVTIAGETITQAYAVTNNSLLVNILMYPLGNPLNWYTLDNRILVQLYKLSYFTN